MRISENEKNEIIRTTQRTFKSQPEADAEFEAFSLDQLRQVDEMLGNRDIDGGYRIRIRNRIKELEEQSRNAERRSENLEGRQEQRTYEKGVRIWSLVTAFVVGVAVTIVSQWLWGIIGGGT